ncbi:MAG: AraC family transcriptional regulator [Bacillota bacterium]|nr:AraC family transcriptional regulator [Bacillota bacterium]
MIACFVVGVVLSYIFSARNYDPVNKLVKKVEQATPNTDHTVNELKMIENAFLSIIEKNRELDKKLNENQDILQAAVLSDLIKGNFASADEIEHMCQELQIEFPFERFILLYIPPENSDEQPGRDSCLYINDLKSLASIAEYTIEAYLINNINHHTKFYIVVENNSIFCLLNTTARTAEEHNRSIYGIAEQLQLLFIKTFKKTTPIFISKTCLNIMDLSACQQQLHVMTDYRAVFAATDIVSYNQMEDATIPDNSLLEQEVRYANAVERGDYAGACSIIEQTIVDYFTPLKRSIYAIRQYIINLSKYMPLANYNLEDSTDIKLQVKGQDLKKTITSCQTADEIIVKIKKLFASWSVEAKDEKASDERDFIGKVIRYIDENYCDVNLNVSTTAIHFNTNISYLSRAFKKNTGIRLLDYINRKRLYKSISLLKQMPLEEVIRQSGFSNIVSYIRIFKKQFGTTPGKYRENI